VRLRWRRASFPVRPAVGPSSGRRRFRGARSAASAAGWSISAPGSASNVGLRTKTLPIATLHRISRKHPI